MIDVLSGVFGIALGVEVVCFAFLLKHGNLRLNRRKVQ